MAAKTDISVVIDDKVFTVSGYESEEYMQKVATYINNKMAEYNKLEAFRRMTKDYQCILLQLNIADDYFKAKKQIQLLEEEIKEKDDELCGLKHELISTQIKLENTDKSLKGVRDELNENVKKIIRLETELKEREKKN